MIYLWFLFKGRKNDGAGWWYFWYIHVYWYCNQMLKFFSFRGKKEFYSISFLRMYFNSHKSTYAWIKWKLIPIYFNYMGIICCRIIYLWIYFRVYDVCVGVDYSNYFCMDSHPRDHHCIHCHHNIHLSTQTKFGHFKWKLPTNQKWASH